jgi:hypothetical protein
VGLEPTTPCLKGRCSNRLSYGPLMRQTYGFSHRAIGIADFCEQKQVALLFSLKTGKITPYIIRILREKSICLHCVPARSYDQSKEKL